MKKPFLSALAIILMCAFLASCSAGSSQNSNRPASSTDGTRDGIEDSLPDKDFGNEKFTILIREEYAYELDVEEQSEDRLESAIHNRNLTIEERFNVDLNYIKRPSLLGAGNEEFQAFVRSSVQSDDDTFQLVAGYAGIMPHLISESLFLNWYDIDYVDFDKPWWSKDAIDQYTVNNKIYMITGDISLQMWDCIHAMVFNKKLAQNYDIPNLYEEVKGGTWTLDRFIEYSKLVSNDEDGNNKWDANDLYGYASSLGTDIDNFMPAFDIQAISKNAAGELSLTVYNEKSVGIVDTLKKFIHTSNNAYNTSIADSMKMFEQNQVLFLTPTLGEIVELRGMDTDFGIIPYPKYDENQDNYYTSFRDHVSMFAVPTTVDDTEMVGIITEALCAEGYKQIIPEYYEIALKTKTTRDDESAAMLDLIRESIVWDFGYFYSMFFEGEGGPGQIMRKSIQYNGNMASRYDSNKKLWEKHLEEVIDFYNG